jgi:hypothetical protein
MNKHQLHSRGTRACGGGADETYFPICNRRISNGEHPATHQSPMETEGSMKMMSWSRYHCLSWSFVRAEHRHRGGRIHQTPHRSRGVIDLPRATSESFLARLFRAGCFQSVIKTVRTKARPRDTEV